MHFPLANVHDQLTMHHFRLNAPVPNYLRDNAYFHKELILDGCPILLSSDIYKAPNSIIQTRFGSKKYVGQVLTIFTHTQEGCPGPKMLLHVRWFADLGLDVLNTDI